MVIGLTGGRAYSEYAAMCHSSRYAQFKQHGNQKIKSMNSMEEFLQERLRDRGFTNISAQWQLTRPYTTYPG